MTDRIPTPLEEHDRRVEHLKELEDAGERYVAFTCDRMGELNLQLIAISAAGWHLHSVVPFVLPRKTSPDSQSYFAVIAEPWPNT